MKLSELFANIGSIQNPLESHFPKNTLTVCMIVKNEEKNIRDAVESFSSFADEIVVNDTGSTDNTLNILKTLSVKVITSEWKDDFSYSRNLSLEAATSSWVMWMDADDRVPDHSVSDINKLKTAPLDRAFGLQIVNTQGGQALGSRFMQLRMFPNSPKIRFRRRIHEQVIFDIATLGLHTRYIETEIHHVGYEDEQIKKNKAKRNLPLSLGDPDWNIDPVISMQAGDAYSILEDWSRAIECYKHANEIPDCKAINVEIYNELPNTIGRAYQKNGNVEEALNWFQIGISRNENRVEPYYFSGEIKFRLGKYREALELYLKILSMERVYTSVGSQYDAIRIYSFNGVCRCYTELKEFEEVRRYAEQWLSEFPKIVESRVFLGRYYLSRNEPEKTIQYFEETLTFKKEQPVEFWQGLLLAYDQVGNDTKVSEMREKLSMLGAEADALRTSRNLSICMIVKNEEESLPKCLKSIQGLWDELVIVDTGSTDKTKEIIQSFGATLVEFEWINDFSAARNISLKYATGNWVLWLDADDIMLEEDKLRIKAIVQTTPDRAYGFLVKNSTDGGKTGSVFNQIRMFPNFKNLLFEGAIHEQVLPSIERNKMPVEYSTIKVIHSGYLDDDIVAQKQKRNLDILLSEHDASPDTFSSVKLYSVGGAYQDLKEFENAMSWYQRSMDRAQKTGEDPHILAVAPFKIGACLASLGKLKEALNITEERLKVDPAHGEGRLLLAQILDKLERDEEAANAYLNLFYFQEQNTFIPIDYQQNKIKAAQFLGEFFQKKGKSKLAIEVLRLGVALGNGGNISFGKVLSLLFDAEEYAHCKSLLKFEFLIGESADNYLNLSKVYIMLGDAQAALEHLNQGVNRFPDDAEISSLLQALQSDLSRTSS